MQESALGGIILHLKVRKGTIEKIELSGKCQPYLVTEAKLSEGWHLTARRMNVEKDKVVGKVVVLTKDSLPKIIFKRLEVAGLFKRGE
jgi:hypothetical protein